MVVASVAPAVVASRTGVSERPNSASFCRQPPQGGTGLGLAISLEDARLHDGTLEAWGSPGEGAQFRLTLPLRAGLPITGHPLPLAPERAEPEPVLARDPAGPQALPGDLMAEVRE